MTFIDNRQAMRLSAWCKKYPQEANAYFKEHSKLSQLFIAKKISFEEFEKQSIQLKDKYNFLEEK